VGLDEERFWEMTVAEIQRYVDGAIWRMRSKAQFDYSLANLIGISVARIMSNDVTYPPIEDVYPDLFEEEIKAKRQAAEEELKVQSSVNNFLAFAMKHNSKHKESEKLNDDNNE
jgi:hypothetical protein